MAINDWPRLSWMIDLRPSSGRAEASTSRMRIDVSGHDVGVIMRHLGWSWDGGATLGMDVLGEVLNHVQDNAADHCGYDFYGNGVDLSANSKGAWSPMDSGSSPLMISTMGRLLAKRDDGGLSKSRSGSKEDGDSSAALAFAASMIDMLHRLGAQAVIGWRENLGQVVLGDSKIPKNPTKLDNGAGFCIDFTSGILACAQIGPAAAHSLENSALGQAFNPWRLFNILASSKAMREVCAMRAGVRYVSHGLGERGEWNPSTFFPCQLATGLDFAAEDEAMAKSTSVFREVFGTADVIVSMRRRSLDSGMGGEGPESMDDWLAEVAREREAKVIAEACSASPAGAGAKSPRL